MMKAKNGTKRLLLQALWTALTNGYLYGYLNGTIYKGRGKLLCVPGLNCYSCPGALGACPIGALQAVLSAKKFRFSCYVFGFLLLFGSAFGRFICGWFCPFGMVQDLLHRIPLGKKRRTLPGERYLRLVKYGVLVLLVILLPSVAVNVAGIGKPWFCQYLCPSGTLMGGIPLLLGNPELREAAGWLFSWKMGILFFIAVLSVKLPRPFCRYLCPLGAIYGAFQPVSLFRLKIHEESCTACGSCRSVCPMDVKVRKKPNSAECIRCGACVNVCPAGAIEKVGIWRVKNSGGKAND